MPFVAPIAGAVAGALIGRGGRKKANQLEERSLALKERLAATGERYAGMLFPYAQSLYGSGMEALEGPRQYWSNLLSGNREQLTETLSPEVEGINRRYSDALSYGRELSPRGGASTSFYSELPFKQAGEVSNLILNARQGAAGNLASLGTNMIGQGAGYAGAAGSFLGGAGNQASGLLDYASRRRDQANLYGQQIGSGISSLVSALPWNKWNIPGWAGGGGG